MLTINCRSILWSVKNEDFVLNIPAFDKIDVHKGMVEFDKILIIYMLRLMFASEEGLDSVLEHERDLSWGLYTSFQSLI